MWNLKLFVEVGFSLLFACHNYEKTTPNNSKTWNMPSVGCLAAKIGLLMLLVATWRTTQSLTPWPHLCLFRTEYSSKLYLTRITYRLDMHCTPIKAYLTPVQDPALVQLLDSKRRLKQNFHFFFLGKLLLPFKNDLYETASNKKRSLVTFEGHVLWKLVKML